VVEKGMTAREAREIDAEGKGGGLFQIYVFSVQYRTSTMRLLWQYAIQLVQAKS
jgi:hypothetical protein